jgi:protein arginine kinase activator
MDKCPITGLPCEHPKTVHVTDVGKDYVATNYFDICQLCGLKDKTSKVAQNILDFFDSVIKNKIQNITPPDKEVQTKSPCPSCGMTIKEIAKASRLGCPDCYEHYKEELIPVIMQNHGSIKHKGKSPTHPAENVSVEEQIKGLELRLKQEIELEHYEEAQKIKDKIAKLKA